MHGIGNEHDAQTILSWVRSHPKEYGRPTCVTYGDAPEGWEFVGNGSFRSVWLSPEGVAYKVEHEGRYSAQSEEEVTLLGLAWSKGAPYGCRLPRFERFIVADNEIVVAIEYIHGRTLYQHCEDEGHDDELYEKLNQCEDRFGLGDLHDENALVDEDGYLVPVDFGA